MTSRTVGAGAFVQPATGFCAFVAGDGSSPCPIEARRYHLYVANPRPGAAEAAARCRPSEYNGHETYRS